MLRRLATIILLSLAFASAASAADENTLTRGGKRAPVVTKHSSVASWKVNT